MYWHSPRVQELTVIYVLIVPLCRLLNVILGPWNISWCSYVHFPTWVSMERLEIFSHHFQDHLTRQSACGYWRTSVCWTQSACHIQSPCLIYPLILYSWWQPAKTINFTCVHWLQEQRFIVCVGTKQRLGHLCITGEFKCPPPSVKVAVELTGVFVCEQQKNFVYTTCCSWACSLTTLLWNFRGNGLTGSQLNTFWIQSLLLKSLL